MKICIGIVKYTIFSCVLGLFCWTHTSIYRAATLGLPQGSSLNKLSQEITVISNHLIPKGTFAAKCAEEAQVLQQVGASEDVSLFVSMPEDFKTEKAYAELMDFIKQNIRSKSPKGFTVIQNALKTITQSLSVAPCQFDFGQRAIKIKYPSSLLIEKIATQFQDNISQALYIAYWIESVCLSEKEDALWQYLPRGQGKEIFSSVSGKVDPIFKKFYEHNFGEPINVLQAGKLFFEANKNVESGNASMLKDILQKYLIQTGVLKEGEQPTDKQVNDYKRKALNDYLQSMNDKILAARLIYAMQFSFNEAINQDIVVTHSQSAFWIEDFLNKQLHYTYNKQEGPKDLHTSAYRFLISNIGWRHRLATRLKSLWGLLVVPDLLDPLYQFEYTPVNLSKFFGLSSSSFLTKRKIAETKSVAALKIYQLKTRKK